MPEIRLIGVTGRKQAGKDTFARMLCTLANWKRVAFADALKEDLAWLLGVTPDYIEEHKAALRHALQLRGTQYWREREPNHWINLADERVDEIFARGEKAIVTDVRFVNEAEWIHSRGGVVVKLIRIYESDDQPLDSHVSETENEQIDADAEFVCKTGVHHVEFAARVFLKTLLSRGSAASVEKE